MAAAVHSPKGELTMTPEEQLIQQYFAAFNRHDIEGVMACFHDYPPHR